MITTRPESSLRWMAGLLVVGLSLAGCSGGESNPGTTGAPETKTVAELDAAVRPAAQALLDASDLEATTIYFHFDDPERVYRYDWMTTRSNGNHIVVSNDLDQKAVTGSIQAGEDRFNASATQLETNEWLLSGPALPSPQGTPSLDLVSQMAERGSLFAADDLPDDVVTTQAASDGSAVWRLISQSRLGEERFATVEWIIDSDGALWFYRLESDREPLSESARIIVTRFSIPEDPEPIVAPELGAGLNLRQLGVPEDLLELSN